MECLLRWRMARVTDLLARGEAVIADVVACMRSGSVTTFSTAFTRHFGLPPGRYAGPPRLRRPKAPRRPRGRGMGRGEMAGRA